MLATRATIGGLAAAAALVLLVGCAPEPEPGSTPAASGSPTETPGTPTPTDGPSGSAAPTETPAPDAAECLAGTWELDQAGLDEFYGDINALMEGSGLTFQPQGRAALTLTDAGEYTWAPELAMTAQISGTPMDISIGGQMSGAYVVAGERIAVEAPSTEGLEISASINGEPQEAGEITAEIARAPITDAAFTCADATLTLESAISGGSATTTLHRQ